MHNQKLMRIPMVMMLTRMLTWPVMERKWKHLREVPLFAETTVRDAETEVPVMEVPAADATEILDEAEVPRQPEV
jgi:hypothetical protein